jgi:DNA gyrase subunit A
MKKSRPQFASIKIRQARTLSIKRGTKTSTSFRDAVGIVKKSNLSDYANVRRGGIIAIQIEDGDRLIDAKLTNGNNGSSSSQKTE